MQLKKCGGCARAIVESAAVCQYCGHATNSFASAEPASRPPATEEDPFAFLDEDEGLQPMLPALTTPSADDEARASEVAPAATEADTEQSDESLADAPLIQADATASARAEIELNDRVDVNRLPAATETVTPAHREPLAAAAPAPAAKRPVPAPPRDREQPPQIVAVDDDLSSFDELWETSASAAPGAPVIAEEKPQAVASAPRAATMSGAGTPPKRGQAKMVAMGLAAGVVLIIAALGMRGTASPAVTVAPVPAPAKTPAKAPAKTPAKTPAPAALVTSQPGAATAVAVPGAPTQAWNRVTDGRWVGRDRRSIALELNANEKVAVWMRQVRPVLVVRCVGKAPEVFVFTQTAAKMEPQDENHTVQVSLDNGQPLTERWADSEEHDALFAPDGHSFAQQLMHSTTLRFGFTPHNAAPVVAEFKVAGLSELLAPSARQCGFKAPAKR